MQLQNNENGDYESHVGEGEDPNLVIFDEPPYNQQVHCLLLIWSNPCHFKLLSSMLA